MKPGFSASLLPLAAASLLLAPGIGCAGPLAMPAAGTAVAGAAQARLIELKDPSYLRSTDGPDTMVVTVGEAAEGAHSGTKRQYWIHQGGAWKIFFEGIIG